MASCQTASGTKLQELKLNTTSITLAQSTKSLGVTIDNKLTLNEHVNNVCKAAHYHVRALRHVRKYISENTAKTIASSLVGARLDYCNAVLYGTSRHCSSRVVHRPTS